MNLSTILKPDAVKVLTSCTSKKRLFHDLGELAETSCGFRAADVVDALIESPNLQAPYVRMINSLEHLYCYDQVKGAGLLQENRIAFQTVVGTVVLKIVHIFRAGKS